MEANEFWNQWSGHRAGGRPTHEQVTVELLVESMGFLEQQLLKLPEGADADGIRPTVPYVKYSAHVAQTANEWLLAHRGAAGADEAREKILEVLRKLRAAYERAKPILSAAVGLEVPSADKPSEA